MIEEGTHLSGNGMKLLADILLERSSTISPPLRDYLVLAIELVM